MRRRLTAGLLAACLLTALASCGPEEMRAAPGPFAQGAEKEYYMTPPVRPEPQPDRSWDGEHELDTDWRPELQGGLELPIQGATGYATVAMGLWEEPLEPDLEPGAEVTDPGAAAGPDTAPDPGAADPDTTPDPGAAAGPDTSSDPGAIVDPDTAPDPGAAADPDTTPDPGAAVDPETAAGPEGAEAGTDPGTEEAAEEPDPFQGSLAVLEPGTAFTILEEDEGWWKVECEAGTGWVEHRYCMINLPDVIPSMVYDATNSYDSLYRSSGKEIPGVTGEQFYPGKTHNPRLDREEFMMPVLYAMALKLCQAQQAALAEGNTLVLYEGYRPHSTQVAVRNGLSALSRKDPEVEAGLSQGDWTLGWFIAMGYSNHQRGYAVDISVAKVWETERRSCGEYKYLSVEKYTLYDMPTAMHELSSLAVTYTSPNSGELAEGMNEPALALQRYCTGVGLSPLASEWWHFNDLAARELAQDNLGIGDFVISQCLSRKP